ncbi:hypothetical protein JCM10207_007103 [Rhodosporidiobolus poonsookiae]
MYRTTQTTRILPTSRRLLATTPTGRPAAVDTTTNLGAQQPAGYGGSQGPLPQAGGPTPPKKSNTGLIVGSLALVAGAATYYLTLEDPSAAAKSDLHKLEAGAQHELSAFRKDGARSTSEPLGPTPGAGTREAERYAASLRSPDGRYGAEQVKDAAARHDGHGVKDEVKAWGEALKSDERAAWKGAEREASRWGDALSTTAKKEERAFQGVIDETKAWGRALRAGPDERDAWAPAIDEVRRYRDLLRGREHGSVEHVERYLGGLGLPSHNVTEGGNVWLDWIGGGKGVRRRAAEQKLDHLEAKGQSYYESAKSTLSNKADEAKHEAKGWFNWGERKAENAKDRAAADYERTKEKAKDEAASWSSWTSAKANDAASAVSSAASSVEHGAKDAYNSAAGAASSAYNQTASAAQNAGEKAKAEGASWWNWSGEKAGEAKDGVKEGLLKAEHGVERGAQKAQDETKKL